MVLQQHSSFFVKSTGGDDYEVRSFRVYFQIDGPTCKRGCQVAVASHYQKRLATDVCHQLTVTCSFRGSDGNLSFGHFHLAQQKMNPAHEPRTIFQQRRRELCRGNHFFNILIGNRSATFAASRITHCHHGKRMRIWQAKEGVSSFTTTDLHFPLDESRILESLNWHAVRLRMAGEKFCSITFLMCVTSSAQKDARAFIFEV